MKNTIPYYDSFGLKMQVMKKGYVNMMKKLYCRIVQKIMYVVSFALPWREPELFIGDGKFLLLPDDIREKGIHRVLIITDKGLMGIGLLDPLFTKLTEVGIQYTLYDKVVPNPTTDNIEECVILYRENHCQGIIAVGGGSPMDCAKGTGARIANPKKPILKMKGILKVGRKLPPLYAVPTTAGTGSETTLAAVITESVTHHKYAINDPALIPYAAVLDPLLTVKLPPHITSTTGMDALCHAVEAYIGNSNTRKTKKNAAEAVKIIFDNILKVYEDGADIIARTNMQRASYLAGLAFTRAYVGCVHAVAHTLGGQYQIPHGLANAVIMPYVFRAYGESAHRKLAELAELVDIKGMSQAEKAEGFIRAIEELNQRMKIQTKIPQIKTEDIPKLVKYAEAEANPLYPTPKVLGKEDFEKIYLQLQK